MHYLKDMCISSNLIRRRPRGFRKRPNLKGSAGGGRFDHHVPASVSAVECASYVGEVVGSGSGHHHRTGRGQSQMRYTPYDVPTGVLSPPPDYGKGQSQISETDSWSGCLCSYCVY